MAWISLSVADVKNRLAGVEVAALQTAALASGQTDPTASIISGVVLEVKGRLRNKMTCASGEVVPDNLKHHTLAIIVHRLCTRLPLGQLLTPARLQEYQDAVEVMRQYGPILPDEPTVADATAVVGQNTDSPAITAQTLTFTREDTDGL